MQNHMMVKLQPLTPCAGFCHMIAVLLYNPKCGLPACCASPSPYKTCRTDHHSSMFIRFHRLWAWTEQAERVSGDWCHEVAWTCMVRSYALFDLGHAIHRGEPSLYDDWFHHESLVFLHLSLHFRKGGNDWMLTVGDDLWWCLFVKILPF